jgi:hypothetical protein
MSRIPLRKQGRGGTAVSHGGRSPRDEGYRRVRPGREDYSKFECAVRQ